MSRSRSPLSPPEMARLYTEMADMYAFAVARWESTSRKTQAWKFLDHALNFAQGYARPHFNRAAGNKHRQPALLLEAQAGLSNIGHVYRMPDGIPADTLEAYILTVSTCLFAGWIDKGEHQSRLQRVFNTLAARNDVLRTLRYDPGNNDHLFHINMGATSGFHTDDIQFFIDGNVGWVAEADPAWRKKQGEALRALQARAPGTRHLGWIPSPRTLEKIACQAAVIPRR